MLLLLLFRQHGAHTPIHLVTLHLHRLLRLGRLRGQRYSLVEVEIGADGVGQFFRFVLSGIWEGLRHTSRHTIRRILLLAEGGEDVLLFGERDGARVAALRRQDRGFVHTVASGRCSNVARLNVGLTFAGRVVLARVEGHHGGHRRLWVRGMRGGLAELLGVGLLRLGGVVVTCCHVLVVEGFGFALRKLSLQLGWGRG